MTTPAEIRNEKVCRNPENDRKYASSDFWTLQYAGELDTETWDSVPRRWYLCCSSRFRKTYSICVKNPLQKLALLKHCVDQTRLLYYEIWKARLELVAAGQGSARLEPSLEPKSPSLFCTYIFHSGRIVNKLMPKSISIVQSERANSWW